jgi:hypothetical protein
MLRRLNSGPQRVSIEAVAEEAARNPLFLSNLERALAASPSKTREARPHRRKSGALDPFRVLSDEGAEKLREHLSDLSLDQLRDIVAEHRMDRSNLVMKWKSQDRVVEHIVATVAQRSRKGDAFRE